MTKSLVGFYYDFHMILKGFDAGGNMNYLCTKILLRFDYVKMSCAFSVSVSCVVL